MESVDYISKFAPTLWSAAVNTVVVHHNGHLVIKLFNGMEIEAKKLKAMGQSAWGFSCLEFKDMLFYQRKAYPKIYSLPQI